MGLIAKRGAGVEWRAARAREEKYSSRAAASFLRAVRATQAAITPELADVAIRLGKPEALLRAIPMEAWEGRHPKVKKAATPGTYWALEFAALIRDIARAGGQRAIAAVLGPRYAVTSGGFEMTNEFAADYAENRSAGQVTAITEAQRDALQQIVSLAYRDGIPPRAAARELRAVIGLTGRQATWVHNFNARQLASGASAEEAMRATETYGRRVLAYRAETIARTEIMNAERAGVQETWERMQAEGIVHPDAKRRWVAEPASDRTCVVCEALHGVEVGMDEFWEHPETGEAIDVTTGAHPDCRCVAVLVQPRG